MTAPAATFHGRGRESAPCVTHHADRVVDRANFSAAPIWVGTLPAAEAALTVTAAV